MGILNPLTKFGLNIIGAWPGVPVTNFFVLLLGMLYLSMVFQILNLVLVIHELDRLMNNLSTTMPVLLIALKLTVLRLKFKNVRILITEMLDDWKDEEDIDVRKVMIKNTKIALFLSNIVTISYNGLCTCFIMVSVISYGSKSIENRQLVFHATFPMNPKPSPMFEIIFVFQVFVSFFGANGHVVVEGLLIASVIHANTKAFNLCKEISVYCETCLSVSNEKYILKARHKLIQKHLRFIDFTDCIENVFANISFFQVICMTFINCIVGYTLINLKSIAQDNAFMPFLCIAYILTALSAVLSYCAAGEYLKSQGTWIYQELYKCSWYRFGPDNVRILTFILMRSQRPVTITVGNFGDLSLIYFSKIINTSASYLSLVRAASK